MISFIIVTYNSNNLLSDCIKSIVEYSTELDFEIIVVDNSPEDVKPITETVSRQAYNQVVFIPNNNLGYGQGNNVGIRHSKGNIIGIVNPDVRFTEPFFETVKENFVENKKLGLLSFKQIGGENLSFYLKPEFFVPFLGSFIIKFFNRFNFFNPNLFFLSGACFFLDKNKFEEIGFFDENIFMYFEEPDVANRMKKKGYGIHFYSKIQYLHLIGDRTSFNLKTFQIWRKSLFYYLDKYRLNKRKQSFLRKFEYYFSDRDKYVNY